MIANTDGDDPRLDELLLRWEELHEQGQSLSAEKLCSTCPELAGELARRIALLRKMDPLLDETKTASGDRPPAIPAGGSSRESATARADYRDLRFHAAGALGEVFMARNAELNRDVALKFLKTERSRDTGQSAPLPPRGGGHRSAGTPRRRADLRLGDRCYRRALLCDAVHPGRDAPGPHRRLSRRREARPGPVGAFVGVARVVDPLRVDLQHDGLCPQPWDSPSGLEAAERDAGEIRRDSRRGLGSGQALRPGRRGTRGGRGDTDAQVELGEWIGHVNGGRGGDSGVHESGAGRGTLGPRRPRQRPVRPRRDSLRDPDRSTALPGSHDWGGPGEGQAVRVSRATAGQAGCAACARGDLPQGDGQAAGGSVRDGARLGG